jgi:hypothetical protein
MTYGVIKCFRRDSLMENDDVVAESTPLLAQNEDNLDSAGVKYLLVQHFSRSSLTLVFLVF